MEKEEMEAMNSDSDSDSSSSDSSDSSNEVESDDLGEECELSEQQRKEVEGIETNVRITWFCFRLFKILALQEKSCV